MSELTFVIELTILVLAAFLGFEVISKVPTMTMPWMKFVPDMSGVWSIVGTFEITSNPRNAARTRIVSSTTNVSSLTPLTPDG